MGIRAKINVFDRSFVLGDTIEQLGRSFTLGDLVSSNSVRGQEDIEEMTKAVVAEILDTKIGRETRDGFVEIFGTGGKLLGDDLSDVKVRVVRDRVDHNSFAQNNTSYDLDIEIPDSALEEP